MLNAPAVNRECCTVMVNKTQLAMAQRSLYQIRLAYGFCVLSHPFVYLGSTFKKPIRRAYIQEGA